MNLLDRILGRKSDLEPEALPAGTSRADALAVDRYERMLRTAPPETIERIHVEAFEKLTPAQLDLMFERFTAEAGADDEKPTDARPASLAKSATRAEARKPGAIRRTLRVDESTAAGTADPALNGLVGYSIFDSIANFAIASVVWDAWDDGFAGSGGWGDFGDWF
ncbi:hypothetical protein [Leifsonia poae]|uniref:hypothetical protein n=1 Tax=Leifsonia poae TaxID=110933 RepID=UPI003D66CA32